MNRWKVLLAAIVLVSFVPTTSFAQGHDNLITDEEKEAADMTGTHATLDDAFLQMEELINEWETNGYPDNIGHVSYNDATGKFSIGIVEGNGVDNNEIKSLLTNSEMVVFETAKYAYNEMLVVQGEITRELDEKEGIYGVGIGFTTIDGTVTGFGNNSNEFRVVVTVDESRIKEYKEKYQSQYGDMVYIEGGDAGVDDLGVPTEDGQLENSMWLYMSMFTILCAAILGVFVLKRRQLIMVKQSADGNNVTESPPLSKKEVISAIQNSGMEPSDNVYKSIVKEIKHNK